MFDELSFNRLARVAYPILVFLFTVLAWNTSGQGFPKVPGPTWRTPSSLQSSCGADRLAIQTGGSCSIDVEQPITHS
jgi:hypothetical protein